MGRQSRKKSRMQSESEFTAEDLRWIQAKRRKRLKAEYTKDGPAVKRPTTMTDEPPRLPRCLRCGAGPEYIQERGQRD